jgi:Zn-dependent protease
MSGAFGIGRVFGIPVRVHWTLLALGAIVGLTQGAGAIGTLIGAVLLFASVVAHEVSHALVARGFGIATRDIVLTPIGGVARLEDMPRSGRAEVAIAVAGPIASLLIAGAAFLALALVKPLGLAASLLGTLAWSNAMLGLFNLVPAFPMDGGRVLRGVLSERVGLSRATEIASSIGRVVAIAMGIVGLFTGGVSMVLIAFFVWSASGRERDAVRAEEAYARMPRAWDADGRPVPVEIVPAEIVPAWSRPVVITWSRDR